MPLVVENITNGETVYQRCVILTGKCSSADFNESYLTITSKDSAGTEIFPVQTWPVSDGHFKAMVILSPGENNLQMNQFMHGDVIVAKAEYQLTYIPLLQAPPLHLVIMVAKDSPLMIDCPPRKGAGLTTAHSDLDAAISKFRMTAYMWQALTAEDMRAKGLGRRSFRIEEEWTNDTLSQDFLRAVHEPFNTGVRSTAKVHVIRSEKTVAQLRDAQVAQQNPNARRKDDLFNYFLEALKAHGGPFTSSARPVVAGLILDSAYSSQQNMILAHAALGCSNPTGISLGMFGSHLTYSWPRFLEEVPASLLDTAVPGDTVGNDNGECGTAWEACAVGQGAFLHEVGHAFGAPHTTGIMARGYSQHWPRNFLARTAYCAYNSTEGFTVTPGTHNEACWDLSDALSFKYQPHFRLPSDPSLGGASLTTVPSVSLIADDDEHDFMRIKIESPFDIVRIRFQDVSESEPSIANPANSIKFTSAELEARFDRTKALKLSVLGGNGQEKVIANVWKLFSNATFIRVPGHPITLQKRSITNQHIEKTTDDQRTYWEWAVLLNERGKDGSIARATEIDARVGCILDGAVVHYSDGHNTPCGPRWNRSGAHHHFGGGESRRFRIPEGVEIVKVEVAGAGRGWGGDLSGLMFHMSDGSVKGNIHGQRGCASLEADKGSKIIGFYGKSDYGRCFDGIAEFGIITAPRDVILPDVIYDMDELKNTDGGLGPRPPKGGYVQHEQSDNDVDSDESENEEDSDNED